MKKIISIIIGILILIGGILISARILLFPIKYKSDIKTISKEYKIDPYLLAAITNFESRFEDKPYEKNSKNGILRFEDELSIGLSKELNMKDFRPENLVDEKVSLKLGAYYISKSYDKGVSEVVQNWNVKNGEKDRPNFNRKEYAKKYYLPKIEKHIKIYKVLYPELKN